MTHPDDHELRRRFAALRREDASQAPSFAATRAALERRSPRRLPRILWLVAAASVALLLLVLRPQDPAPAPAAAAWRGPTDFLLRVPGADLLRSVPEVGRVNVPSITVDIDRRTP